MTNEPGLSGHVRSLIQRVPVIARCWLFVLLSVLLVSCGQKGPPTIKAYERPLAPSDLVAYHREERMTLSWSYPDNLRSSLSGFLVLRSEKDGFERLGSTARSESSFVDETFKPDVLYHYKVVAQNLKEVLSAESNIITVTPRRVPGTPENLRFSVSPDRIVLFWKDTGEGACYNVYKTFSKGNFGGDPLSREPVCATTFTDLEVSPERPVYYAVRALRLTDVRDEGAASEGVEVTPSLFIPTAPSDLRVVRGDKIYLLWKESPEPWVRGYRVYRKIEGERGFAFLGEVKMPAFTDAGKVEGRAWYMIKAAGPAAESEPLSGEAPK